MFLIFTKMLMIGLMLAIGVLIYHLGIVTTSGNRELSALIINVCSPVMTISSVLADDSEFTLEKLGLTVLVCAGMYAVFILFGKVVPPLMGIPKEKRPLYAMLSVFGNAGFIGIPVALSILGSSSMLYVVVVNIFYSLFFYSYGYYEISQLSDKGPTFKPSVLINPGIIACLIALGIYIFQPEVPSFLADTMDHVSAGTTFLSMVVLGVNLAATPLKKVLAVPNMYLFFLLRILALPILMALVLRPLLPDGMMVGSFLLMAAMPAGSMTVMLATEQNVETDTLTSGIIISTLMCLVTVPIVSYFFPV
ncbi:MAG: AEC family transporter [Oscillospiraceae bacterium]|nr:AEC family transporter [Oscillospiraceae bacterium]